MDKKNGLVILALVLVIALIAGIGLLWPKQSTVPVVTVMDPGGLITTIAPNSAEPSDAPAPETTVPADGANDPAAESAPTEAPSNHAATEGPAPVETADAKPVPRAWLLVTVDNKTYAPYALTKTGDYTINQKKKNAVNVIHVTEDSIQMASSTCDNQLCVTEGVVTLDNKGSRILGNYIICLPNGVTLELLNAEEYAALKSK